MTTYMRSKKNKIIIICWIICNEKSCFLNSNHILKKNENSNFDINFLHSFCSVQQHHCCSYLLLKLLPFKSFTSILVILLRIWHLLYLSKKLMILWFLKSELLSLLSTLLFYFTIQINITFLLEVRLFSNIWRRGTYFNNIIIVQSL